MQASSGNKGDQWRKQCLIARGARSVAALGIAALLVSGMAAASPAEAGQANTGSIVNQVRPIAINSRLGKVNASNFPSPGECVRATGLACYLRAPQCAGLRAGGEAPLGA